MLARTMDVPGMCESIVPRKFGNSGECSAIDEESKDSGNCPESKVLIGRDPSKGSELVVVMICSAIDAVNDVYVPVPSGEYAVTRCKY